MPNDDATKALWIEIKDPRAVSLGREAKEAHRPLMVVVDEQTFAVNEYDIVTGV